MADHDPIDRAWRDAQTLLDDQAGRSARRARVLAAVAEDSVKDAPPRVAVRGRWLAAAGILIVSAFMAARFLAGPWFSSPAAHAPAVAHAQKNEMVAAVTPPAAVQPDLAPAIPKVPDQAPPMARAPKAFPEAPPAKLAPPSEMMATSPDAAVAAPPPPPPLAAAPAPPAMTVAPRGTMPSFAAPPPAASVPAFRSATARPTDDFNQLRSAAAAGRTADVQQLLDRQVAVDAADPDGETALMKSIRADQPVTAALLIRHGASLDKKNNAGLSARDLAAQIKDPALHHALGIEP